MKKIIALALLPIIGALSQISASTDTIQELDPYITDGNSFRELVKSPVPKIPSSILHEDGYVELKFKILRSGKVKDIEVIQDTNPKMAEFSKKMVRKWRFERSEKTINAIQPIIFNNGKPQILTFASK